MPKAVENSQPPSSPGLTGAAASCSTTPSVSAVPHEGSELGVAHRRNGTSHVVQRREFGAGAGGTSQSTLKLSANLGRSEHPSATCRVDQGRKRWSTFVDQLLLLQTNRPLETIAKRLNRSPSSILARLRRLGHSADFLGGFKTKDLQQHLQVPPATVRRWQRRGWLKRRKGRITEASLRKLCQTHPEEIPFLLLPAERRLWLEMVMGYPNPCRSTSEIG